VIRPNKPLVMPHFCRESGGDPGCEPDRHIPLSATRRQVEGRAYRASTTSFFDQLWDWPQWGQL